MMEARVVEYVPSRGMEGDSHIRREDRVTTGLELSGLGDSSVVAVLATQG